MFILAHYWGIDEVGVFVLPAALALIGLKWAQRRARSKSSQTEKESDRDDD